MPHNGHASQSFAGNPGSDLRHCIGAVHALQLRAAPEGHCQQTESPVADLQAPHRRQSDLSWNSGTARTQQTVLRNTLASTPGHIHGSGRAHGRHIRIGQPSEPKCAWATQGDGTHDCFKTSRVAPSSPLAVAMASAPLGICVFLSFATWTVASSPPARARARVSVKRARIRYMTARAQSVDICVQNLRVACFCGRFLLCLCRGVDLLSNF